MCRAARRRRRRPTGPSPWRLLAHGLLRVGIWPAAFAPTNLAPRRAARRWRRLVSRRCRWMSCRWAVRWRTSSRRGARRMCGIAVAHRAMRPHRGWHRAQHARRRHRRRDDVAGRSVPCRDRGTPSRSATAATRSAWAALARDVIAANIAHGETIACVTPATHLMLAGVSHWGAYALLGGLAAVRDRLAARRCWRASIPRWIRRCWRRRCATVPPSMV